MQMKHLSVTGMTCGGCVTKVTRALKASDGVGDVKVSLSSGDVTVHYDERRTSPDQLKLAVTGAGYGLKGIHAAHQEKSKGGCCG